MTRILIRILFLAAVVGGGAIYYQQQQDSQVVGNLEDKKSQLQGSVKGISDSIGDQAQELTTRGQEVGEHVSNILESYIKPTQTSQTNSTSNGDTNDASSTSTENPGDNNSSTNNENKPIYEATLDYGRYLYCQQVIKDYENQHP